MKSRRSFFASITSRSPHRRRMCSPTVSRRFLVARFAMTLSSRWVCQDASFGFCLCLFPGNFPSAAVFVTSAVPLIVCVILGRIPFPSFPFREGEGKMESVGGGRDGVWHACCY